MKAILIDANNIAENKDSGLDKMMSGFYGYTISTFHLMKCIM